MPTVTVKGAKLYYEEHGGDGEAILFSHGFLFDHRMFDAQVQALSARFRCVAFDWRGQGRSEVTPSGYDMDSLTDDVVALIDTLGIAPCHFVGLSMGGFAGLRLAIRRPDLLSSLVLINTTAGLEPRWRLPQYLLLGVLGRGFGLRPLVGPVMRILFGRTFMSDPSRKDERHFWQDQIAHVGRVGAFRTLRAVLLGRRAVSGDLHRIRTPTLVIAGEEDAVYSPEQVKGMVAGIPGAQLVCIQRAGHSSTIEQAEAVTQAISGFLARG